MSMKHCSFGAGVVVGLALAFLCAIPTESILGQDKGDEAPSAKRVQEFLAKLRALGVPTKTGVDFHPDALAEARDLWPELGALFHGYNGMKDQKLVLELARQCGPGARGALMGICRGAGKALDPEDAAAALRSISSDRDAAINELLELSRDKSIDDRAGYPFVLFLIGTPADVLIPAEISLLKERDPDVRAAAADSLSMHFGQVNRILYPLLGELMKAAIEDPDFRVRSAAQEVLVRYGIGSGAAIDVFVQGLKARKIDEENAEVLLALTPFISEEVITRVDAMLKSDDAVLRRWGIRLAMTGLRYTRVGILPKLRKAAEDPDPDVQREARKALAALEGEN